MYAVVRQGGKQYHVEEGGLVTVDRLDAEAGSSISLGDVLLVADGDTVSVGTPALAKATVTAQVVLHGLGPKIDVIRYKNKTRSGKVTGSRSKRTTLRITKIDLRGDPASERVARASGE